RGLNPHDQQDRLLLGRETYLTYVRTINAAIHAIKPGLRIFHNSGHITRGDREIAGLNTHLELESLPTGGWGYDHFPMSARYVQGMGMEFLGMTGKFHTTWGEFGGYKHPNALRYEVALSLANGAKISIGDQMHPFGQLDQATYRLIGTAYAEVEAKEPWCDNVQSVADIGVLSIEAMSGNKPDRNCAGDIGAVRVLQEGHFLYDVIDADADFSRYKVIILPDEIPVEAMLVEKLRAYQAHGGKLFVTGNSLLDAATGEFALDFGVRCAGQSALNPEYIVPRFPLDNWDSAAFVVYANANTITCTSGTVLADRQEPFFNREFEHFCSHQHAPNTKEVAGPAMVATENTVYLAIPAFRLYTEKGQNVLRDIIVHGIRSLLPAPTLQTNLPAQGIQTVMRQEHEGRTIVHLLYASPARRGQGIEVIEDLIPLREVSVTLRVDHEPQRVYLAPQGTELPFNVHEGILTTTVPEMVCHQMVVVE
ncbi:MAG TPA: beta-galactosidase trimerization domain-containing protein, partial [Armatimonadota bacterium]|nr:beta-galactosidase trimerization domain-containing protein [Armatimonadota bacterium]